LKFIYALAFLCACNCVAQQAAVPVEEEPYHKVVLKNEYIELIRVRIPSSEKTLFHIHSHDRAVLYLVGGATTQQLLGRPEQPVETSEVGEVFADSRIEGPLIHRVRNVSKGRVEIFDVEFLKVPESPSSVPAAPVAAENRCARVYDWHLAPGISSAMHTHDRPYLVVAVTPMKLKMTAPDGKSFTHEVVAGDFHWVDSKVTHSLANDGTSEGQIVEFELK
jgi:quercetin dioxygenase-like cupin family protein